MRILSKTKKVLAGVAASLAMVGATQAADLDRFDEPDWSSFGGAQWERAD